MVDSSSKLDALSTTLNWVRLHGSVFAQNELFAPWGVQSQPLPYPVCVVIVSGRAHLTVQERHRVWIQAGDIVVIRAGQRIALRDSPTSPVVPIERFSFTRVRGRESSCTRLVCASLELDRAGGDLFGSALPPILRLPTANAASSARSLVEAVAMEVKASSPPGSDVFVTRLMELLFLSASAVALKAGSWEQVG